MGKLEIRCYKSVLEAIKNLSLEEQLTVRIRQLTSVQRKRISINGK